MSKVGRMVLLVQPELKPVFDMGIPFPVKRLRPQILNCVGSAQLQADQVIHFAAVRAATHLPRVPQRNVVRVRCGRGRPHLYRDHRSCLGWSL